MSNSTVPTVAFQLLSIEATLFSSITGLFGVYVVLFVLAVWATYRRTNKAKVRLRIITWVLFADICIHYTMRTVAFAKVRKPTLEDYDMFVWYVPVNMVAFFTSVTAGLISDGLLAWRLYVVWGQARWTLWVSATAVITTATVGFASCLSRFAFYRNAGTYIAHLEDVGFEVNIAWCWLMLGTNTMLTGAIIGRIVHVARAAPVRSVGGLPYAKIVEATIESALVTWFGLVFYGIATVAPEGRVTTNLDIGFVLGCIIPLFFGISQCLITARLGLTLPRDTPPASQLKQDGGSGGVRSFVVDIRSAMVGPRGSDPESRAIENEEKLAGSHRQSDSERSSVKDSV